MRESTWVASTLLKNLAGEQAPTLTLWHECVAPSEGAEEWSVEQWATWDLSQWESWEGAQDEEWADAQWEAEWGETYAGWDDEDAEGPHDEAAGAGVAASPTAHSSISTPDSAKEVSVFGEAGRLQRARGPTPDGHEGEGRQAAAAVAKAEEVPTLDWCMQLYGVRLAASTEASPSVKAATPSGSARARKFTKLRAVERAGGE
jgi:hypothetical protein